MVNPLAPVFDWFLGCFSVLPPFISAFWVLLFFVALVAAIFRWFL